MPSGRGSSSGVTLDKPVDDEFEQVGSNTEESEDEEQDEEDEEWEEEEEEEEEDEEWIEERPAARSKRSRPFVENRGSAFHRAMTVRQGKKPTGVWGNSSRFRGVSWCNTTRKWSASLSIDRKMYSLGSHDQEEAAAREVDNFVRRMGLENKRGLNLPTDAEAAKGLQHQKGKRGHNTSSRFVGVSYRPSKRRWEARINVRSKLKHLGYFLTEEEAGAAYDQAAAQLGRRHVANFPDSSSEHHQPRQQPDAAEEEDEEESAPPQPLCATNRKRSRPARTTTSKKRRSSMPSPSEHDSEEQEGEHHPDGGKNSSPASPAAFSYPSDGSVSL